MSYLGRGHLGTVHLGNGGTYPYCLIGGSIICRTVLTSILRRHGLGESEAPVEGFGLEKVEDQEKFFYLDRARHFTKSFQLVLVQSGHPVVTFTGGTYQMINK